MKQIATLTLVLAFGLVLAACQLNPNSEGPNSTEDQTNSVDQMVESSPMMEEMDSEATQPAETGEQISLETVAEHASADDCWIAIEGKVYDVTPIIASQQHPGGAAILEGCGQDATEIFNNRPKDGEPHSDQARSILPQYLIGDFKN